MKRLRKRISSEGEALEPHDSGSKKEEKLRR